jgi:SAM-dependent methyltransferase
MMDVACATSGANDADVILAENDYYNRDGLRVVRCRRCGLAYTSRRLVAQESLYTDSFSPNIEPVERARRRTKSTAGYRVEKITRMFGRTGRMLEVGCGDCVFLEESATAGWSVTGIDLSPGSEEMLRPLLGLDIRTASIHALDPDEEQFDVVTAWDVIEHVTDPTAFVRSASRLLIPGGILVLRAPNLAAYRVFLPNWRRWVDRTLRRKYRQYDTAGHIYHFDTKSLSRLAETCGFEVLDIAPDWDYAFSQPKNILSKIERTRSMAVARALFRKSRENTLSELVVYARKPGETEAGA